MQEKSTVLNHGDHISISIIDGILMQEDMYMQILLLRKKQLIFRCIALNECAIAVYLRILVYSYDIC